MHSAVQPLSQPVVGCQLFDGGYGAPDPAGELETMALELAPKIRVNVICPGYVMTPMQKAEYTEEMFAALNDKLPLKRHADPSEVAALFAFLASEDAAYITGGVYVIDGGETAGALASR